MTAAVAAGAFFAWKPGVARFMLASPRALGFTVLVGVLVFGLDWFCPAWAAAPRDDRGAGRSVHPNLMPGLGDCEMAYRQAILLGEVVQEADDRLAHRQRIATDAAGGHRH